MSEKCKRNRAGIEGDFSFPNVNGGSYGVKGLERAELSSKCFPWKH